MLEYPIDEAVELLERNLETARTALQQVEDDLDFLKDQCTTIEVGILSNSGWGGGGVEEGWKRGGEGVEEGWSG